MIDTIAGVRAIEILDSRGHPTLSVEVSLASGVRAVASIPAGASTGRREAVELRDGDASRYRGRGVLRAIRNIEEEICPAVLGRDPFPSELDPFLIELDGTKDKSRLGANAILGVSMAAARAAATAAGTPLYRYLTNEPPRLPMPMFNVINGGKHADGGVDFQEFMIVPVGAPNFREALRYGAETFHALRSLLKTAAGYPTSVGDEGGFAPALPGNEGACTLITKAIEAAGYRPGEDIAIALDPAATSFFEDGAYKLTHSTEGEMTSAELISLYESWVCDYPIVSIEDGMAEDDWEGFRALTERLGARIQIVGDDIYATNTELIQQGIDKGCSNAVLVKPNQIGTLSETLAAVELCRKARWAYVVSHRSGETEDTFIADFAVAMGGGQIKSGSLSRGERIAKYNRLLWIERELGDEALFTNPFKPSGHR